LTAAHGRGYAGRNDSGIQNSTRSGTSGLGIGLLGVAFIAGGIGYWLG
jgi:hypothetical protein